MKVGGPWQLRWWGAVLLFGTCGLPPAPADDTPTPIHRVRAEEFKPAPQAQAKPVPQAQALKAAPQAKAKPGGPLPKMTVNVPWQLENCDAGNHRVYFRIFELKANNKIALSSDVSTPADQSFSGAGNHDVTLTYQPTSAHPKPQGIYLLIGTYYDSDKAAGSLLFSVK